MQLFSSGHSNKTLEGFLEELKSFSIKTLFDIRSKPYSRFCPHFSKKNLENSLQDHGIKYRFAGEELGGFPSDNSVFNKGKPDYQKIMQKEWFRSGIQEILDISLHPAAVMCSEKDPLKCHRFYLVGEFLYKQGVDIKHITGENQIQNHSELRKGMSLPG